MEDEGKSAAPGQITVSRYNKDELRTEMEEEACAQKTAGDEADGDAEDCYADVAKARLMRQRKAVARMSLRVAALLELASL